MKFRQIAFVICLALLLLSCIKEEREKCPTYLTIDLSGTPAEVDSLYLILQYEDGQYFRDTIRKENLTADYEIAVPRGSATIAAYGNISRMIYDHGYITPHGSPSDNIYTYFSEGEYLSDLSSDTITVTKNSMAIHAKVLGAVMASEGLKAEFIGSNTGYSIYGELTDGEFYHSPESSHIPTDAEDYYLFLSRVTRHASDSQLLLRLSTRYPGMERPTTLLEISIPEKLAQGGISFSDHILQDLYLTIDHSRSTITISVDDFDSMEHVEVEF